MSKKPTLTTAIIELLTQTKRNTALLEKLVAGNTAPPVNAADTGTAAPTVTATATAVLNSPKAYRIHVALAKGKDGRSTTHSVPLPTDIIGKPAKIDVCVGSEYDDGNGNIDKSYSEYRSFLIDRLPPQLTIAAFGDDYAGTEMMKVSYYKNEDNDGYYAHIRDYLIWVLDEKQTVTIDI